MTDKDTLMNLIDEYAEARHINGCWVYNIKTAAARQAAIEALSAAPAGWKLVPVEPTKEMVAAACREHGYPGGSRAAYVLGYKSMLAASPTPPAEQQAAPKAAPGERLTRNQIREVFMAHGFTIKEGQADLKQYVYDAAHALLELVAAPQQEAQEPALFVSAKQLADLVDPSHATGGSYLPARKTRAGLFTQPLYTAPQPAPAPLSDDAKDAARYRFLAGHCRSTSEHWGGRWSIIVDGPAPKAHGSEDDFDAAIDAALAAQKGKA